MTKISIHALREEGDVTRRVPLTLTLYFYPRPPRGGRPWAKRVLTIWGIFLSTPSARRATQRHQYQSEQQCISIHALREEGDQAGAFTAVSVRDFYPRPPRGGRRTRLLGGAIR